MRRPSTPEREAGAQPVAVAVRPRLLFVSPLPPPPGGISGWTLRVLASPLAQEFEIEVVDTAPRESVSVQSASRFRVGRAAHALGLVLRLLARALRFRPALVHVNTSYYWAFPRDGLMLWLASLLGARTLMHFRGGDFELFYRGCRPPLRAFVRATLARADCLIAVTRDTERFLRDELGLARIRYLPNFAGAAPRPASFAAAAPGAPVEVLYVGWMIEAKGVRELLEAARALPAARFTLVGPGQPEFAASIRAELAALADRVRWIGPREHAEVLGLYARADVFVLPTWREGFPNVLVEAMAAGLPVVSTRVGAIPDIVRDGIDGFVIEPRDAAALAERLRRLVDEPALRRGMGASARERFERCFSADAVLAELGALYRGLIAGRVLDVAPARGSS